MGLDENKKLCCFLWLLHHMINCCCCCCVHHRPYIVCFWAVLDFCFLYGAHPFAKHWLFWQNKLDLFNEANPVVGVTDSNIYMRILISFIFFGITVSLKRLFLAIYLGRRTVAHFGSELEKLMAKMILIGEVANLARDIENKRALFEGPFSPTGDIEGECHLSRVVSRCFHAMSNTFGCILKMTKSL